MGQSVTPSPVGWVREAILSWATVSCPTTPTRAHQRRRFRPVKASVTFCGSRCRCPTRKKSNGPWRNAKRCALPCSQMAKVELTQGTRRPRGSLACLPVAASTEVLTSDVDRVYRAGDAPEGGALPPRAERTWSHSSRLHERCESSAPSGPSPTFPARVHKLVPARVVVAASMGSAVPRR